MTDARTAAPGKKHTGISFRLALPLGQLTLCALMLWPTRGFIFYELGLPEWTQGTPFLIRFGGPPMAAYAGWSQHNGMETVAALNLPAGLVQLPYDILSTDHREWTPGHMDFQVWRAITWPILGMIFWWLAGRGADALVAARGKRFAPRIGRIETIIGFLVAAGGAAVIVAFVFAGGDDRRDAAAHGMLAAAGMWALLGGLTVAARIVQWRMRKALRGESAAPA